MLLLLACVRQPPTPEVETYRVKMPPQTRVSGVVFEFDTRALVPNAPLLLHLEGQDPLSLMSDSFGYWKAEVPDGVPFTPELNIEGYLPARHATFVVGEGTEDQPGYLAKPERLDLQAVPLAVFDEMATSLAGTPLRRDACLVVDTVAVAQVYSMASFAEFLPLRPHGEPGVRMRLEPDPGVDPIYFNEDVRPDRSLSQTTLDGGVLWLNVPPGTYTITGEQDDPELEVVPRQVECLAGELINLNPPMGAGVRVKL
jgi:hypothetical protein